MAKTNIPSGVRPGLGQVAQLSIAQVDEGFLPLIEKSNDVSIQIGDKAFEFDARLAHIAQAINESKYILDLKDDWDDDGASSTDLKTYLKAVNFLVRYSKIILEKYLQIIDAPLIDIMRDGSVSILGETDNATFLIIFKKKDTEYSYFYGEEKRDKIPFNYAIKNEDDVNEITALWMSQNLK